MRSPLANENLHRDPTCPADNKGLSGIHPLANARDSFAVRVLFARMAKHTLDVQYYIWHKDTTGLLLLNELLSAARRGVHVRLLLDDNGIAGLDAYLSALNEHPNIEVRLFNPFAQRRHKWLGYLTDFSRANRRMHNKAFVMDNRMAIIGGRNIGDEYFAATHDVLFADLDMMIAGDVIKELSASFNRYWTSQPACPIEQIIRQRGTDALNQLNEAVQGIFSRPDAEIKAYLDTLQKSVLIHQMMTNTLDLEWTHVRMVCDDPVKSLGKADDNKLVITQLQSIFENAKRSITLVSPYFVPTATGTHTLRKLADQGLQIRILTNSHGATDVLPVHAGYNKWRKKLLKSNINLYEMKRLADIEYHQRIGRLGSSGSSLHAKTFAVDGERIFVGSFNFDPRSAKLNTELGFIIDSSTLSSQLDSLFNRVIPNAAYEVQINAAGRLSWLERLDDDHQRRHRTEPDSSFFQRLVVRLLGMLPIDWLL